MMSAESNSEKSVSYQKKDGLFSRDVRHVTLHERKCAGRKETI